MAAADAAAHDRQNVEVVHDRLRRAILRGEIAPGEELSQVRLAQTLGVSRTPLREAFRLLQHEGLVEARSNRSYRVTTFSATDLEELYLTQLPLQALAVRLTIPRLTSADIAAMEGDLAQMSHYASIHDVDGWEGPHTDFHRRLVQHAGRRVVDLLDQLSDHAGRYRRVYLAGTSYGFDAAAAEHREILDAARAGDADGAAARLVRHLAHTAFDVLAMADAEHEPHALQVALAVAETSRAVD
jgi:DNA-binding GntR family transcriptional regulator